MKIHINILNVFPSLKAILVASLCLVSMLGCNPRGETDLQQEHANTYLTDEELEGYEEWVKEQENYTATYNDLLKEADAKLENLEEKMAELSQVKQAKVREDIRHLESQIVVLKEKLREIDHVNEQNWTEVKQEVDQAADSLRFSMENLDETIEFGGA